MQKEEESHYNDIQQEKKKLNKSCVKIVDSKRKGEDIFKR